MRVVAVQPADVEVGDTIDLPGAATFVVAGRRQAVNGYALFVNGNTPPDIYVVPLTATVRIQIP